MHGRCCVCASDHHTAMCAAASSCPACCFLRFKCAGCVRRKAGLPHPLATLPAGQLLYQPLSTSITSLPPSLLASGTAVPFQAGTPLTLWAPEVPGFSRFPGETIALSGAFACEGSLRCEGRGKEAGCPDSRPFQLNAALTPDHGRAGLPLHVWAMHVLRPCSAGCSLNISRLPHPA